jgi:riboflavin synthase
MFSGIIENLGQVLSVEKNASNLIITISSTLAPELKIDQSIAHNGICLTVVHQTPTCYQVVAIEETIQRTTIGQWKVGDQVNLERCVALGHRMDGHLVQGHVDTRGQVQDIENLDGSWKFQISYPTADITVPKGSITINGVSLTVVDSAAGKFSVCIIPYTFEHTTFQYLQKGDEVNLEFDIIGKYVTAYLGLTEKAKYQNSSSQ